MPRAEMPSPTVEHMIIHFASTPEEVLVCPGKAGARAKPGEPIATIDGVCYTISDLQERAGVSAEKLRQAERELVERGKK